MKPSTISTILLLAFSTFTTARTLQPTTLPELQDAPSLSLQPQEEPQQPLNAVPSIELTNPKEEETRIPAHPEDHHILLPRTPTPKGGRGGGSSSSSSSSKGSSSSSSSSKAKSKSRPVAILASGANTDKNNGDAAGKNNGTLSDEDGDMVQRWDSGSSGSGKGRLGVVGLVGVVVVVVIGF